ncbi:TPA: DUF3959 family protein, partial [Bacillus cereus]
GGLLAMLLHRKEQDDNKENINLFQQKKKRKKLSFKIPLPRLPKFKIKLFKFGGKASKRKTPEKIREHNYEEPASAATYEMIEQIQQYKEGTAQGQTRMERRRNRYNI